MTCSTTCPRDLYFPRRARHARARPLEVRRERGDHFKPGRSPQVIDLATLDVVLMRQDPPFDMAYITATHILEHIHPKTLVVNDPVHVRNAPEKLFVTHFQELMPPTLITSDREEIRSFRRRTRTSSSSRCTAMAAPACSASSRTTRTSARCWRCSPSSTASR